MYAAYTVWNEIKSEKVSVPSHGFLKKIVYYTKATKMLVLEYRINYLMLSFPWKSKLNDSKNFPIYIIPWSISVGAEYNTRYNNDDFH